MSINKFYDKTENQAYSISEYVYDHLGKKIIHCLSPLNISLLCTVYNETVPLTS